MTIARSQQIDLSVTPYYHCVNRCVRRAFLCGEDHLTGINYEHRREWIADKIKVFNAFCLCYKICLADFFKVVKRNGVLH